MQRITFLILLGIIISLQSVTAHGGEDKEGLTNLQIMLISISACVVFYVFSNKFSIFFKESGTEKYLLTLAAYTGVVHTLLGIDDSLLLLGGVGVISVITISSFTDFGRTKNGLFRIILGGVVISMFIAYFVSNHDLHYIAEDYLGMTTKIAELGIIGLLIKKYKDESKNDSTLTTN